jgi:hypothetical protein
MAGFAEGLHDFVEIIQRHQRDGSVAGPFRQQQANGGQVASVMARPIGLRSRVISRARFHTPYASSSK